MPAAASCAWTMDAEVDVRPPPRPPHRPVAERRRARELAATSSPTSKQQVAMCDRSRRPGRQRPVDGGAERGHALRGDVERRPAPAAVDRGDGAGRPIADEDRGHAVSRPTPQADARARRDRDIAFAPSSPGRLSARSHRLEASVGDAVHLVRLVDARRRDARTSAARRTFAATFLGGVVRWPRNEGRAAAGSPRRAA